MFKTDDMKWFKWIRKKELLEPLASSTAQRIAAGALKMQEEFARLMNHHFSKLSERKRKIAVVIFFLLSGGLSLFFLTHALISVKNKPVIIVAKLQVPSYGSSLEEHTRSDIIIAKESFEKVEVFKHYLDSLCQMDRHKYQQLLRDRPGLVDSIHLFEQIYYLQKIK